MSKPGKAVFLSYASEDVEAARRICATLRAADVEVWFDQNELVGGDAWDAKIRGQIKACALFVPIISANTQARREGYFRIEWKLAAQRTHAMAEGTPFLLPVVIDDTPEVDALVPGEFREVQWTRLPGGETTPVFTRTAQAMLTAAPTVTATVPPFHRLATRPPIPPRAGSSSSSSWSFAAAALAMGAVAAGAGWWWSQGRATSPQSAASTPGTPGPTTIPRNEADEVTRLRNRIVPDHWEKGDFAVMSAALDRILQRDPENAEAWALRSIINSLQTIRQFDRGAKPLELGKEAADRALRLAPELPLGELAEAMHLIAMLSRGGDDESYRASLDRVLAKLPRDPLTRFTELLSYYHAYDFAGTERSARTWLGEVPDALFPAWIMSSTWFASRQADEAEKWVPVAAGGSSVTAIRALVTQFEVRYYLRADLAGARAALETVPRSGRSVHRVVHAHWLLAMAEQRWDEALQVLQRLPEPLFSDRTYHGPRALLAGLSHRSAGRSEAAATQFRESERILREFLSRDPENEALHAALAVTLACAGRVPDARSALGQVEPLVSGRPPSLYRGPLAVMIAQAYREMNDVAGMARWLRKLFFEPSDVPFTPESLRLDPRFRGATESPEIQALMREFTARTAKPPATSPAGTAPVPPSSAPGAFSVPVPAKSVAVLPFANLSAGQDSEFFAEGMHDEVITRLAKIRDLKVISRTSVLSYRDASARNVKRVAAELGVAHVLEATVHRQGNQVRLSAKLIDAQRDEHLWVESFQGELTDVFALQARLAQEIAGALKATLTPGERALINERPTENPAAYEWYLRARHEEHRLSPRSSVSAWEQTAAAYEQALALDPKLAIAHARIARIHGSLYWFSHHDPTPARRDRAEAALRVVERIAPDAPETDYARGGFEYFCNNDWRRSLEFYERALRQLPNDSGLIAQKGYAHRRLGEWRQALECLERALSLDPGDFYIAGQVADFLQHLRQYEPASLAAQRLLRVGGDDSVMHMVLVRTRFALDGNVEQFLRGLDAVPPAGSDPERLFPRLMRALYAHDFKLADELLQRPQPTAVNDLGGIYSEPVALQRAMVAFLAGQPERARQFAGAALRELEGRTATLRQEAFARIAVAQAKAFLGSDAEAASELRAAAALAIERDAYAGPNALREVGRALIVMQRPEEALEVLREIMRRPTRLSAHEARLDPFWSRLKDHPQFEAVLRTGLPIR